ncbi:MAG: tetratricopeptide repeat protein [Tepidisphaeraceae bacterium]|jgi:predicted O-linked N-acetylglucosamine transferase (SPINDLY family)
MPAQTTQQLFEEAEKLFAARRLQEAETLYRRVLEQDPNHPGAQHMIGIILFGQGRHADAVAAIRRAIAADPASAEFHRDLGAILAKLNDTHGAAAAFIRASELDLQDATALMRLGELYASQYRTEQAMEAFAAAVLRKPDSATALNNLGMLLKDMGQMPKAMDCFQRALAIDPNRPEIDSNRVYATHFIFDDPAAILAEHRIWDRRHAQPLAAEIREHPNDRDPNRRLRIGYLSPDFYQHVQALFTIPLLSRPDRANFEIFCYADVPNPDSYTRELRTYCSAWRETAGKSDAEIAQMIRADRIDVLIDLTMHMSRGRPLVMARRPAPVQIAWLAYPGTTGLSAIDYRLTDPHLDPPGIGDEFYTEKSIRLPETFWCYDPLTENLPVNPLPALASGHITFGCLNNFCKISDDLLQLWSQVMHQVPSSRLVLLAPEGSARQRVLDVTGLPAKRIDFVPIQTRPQYLQTYHRIDLGLDTFPYNGHTSSLDSLWMGVPVITLSGRTPVSRAGLSQAMNLDLPDLVSHTREDFVNRAVIWTQDLPRLAELRSNLRPRMAKSPLMDSSRFARHIESVYRDLWRVWCKGT